MLRISNPAVLTHLTRRLERLEPDQPRRWGRMTAHQMALHLAQVAEAVLGRQAFEVPDETPKRVIKVVALYLPLRWPRELPTRANPAGVVVSADAFPTDRARAITTLEDLAGASPGRLVDHHPIFGPMTHAEWHRWAFLHADHHLRQFGL